MADFKGVTQLGLDNNRIGIMGTEGNISVKKEKWEFGAAQGVADNDNLISNTLRFQPDSQIIKWELFILGVALAQHDELIVQRRTRSSQGVLGDWTDTTVQFTAGAANTNHIEVRPTALSDGVFFENNRDVTPTNPTSAALDKFAREFRLHCDNAIVAPGGGGRAIVSLIHYINI